MKLNTKNFLDAAKHNGMSYSDEELRNQIEVHQCLVVYFRTRKEPLIASSFSLQLMSLEGYATNRGWTCKDEVWKPKAVSLSPKTDGMTFVCNYNGFGIFKRYDAYLVSDDWDFYQQGFLSEELAKQFCDE